MEDAFVVKGGKKLEGEVNISGAKNAALKLIIASLLFEEKIILENVPKIKDVEELIHLLNLLGIKVNFIDDNVLEIDPSFLNKNQLDFYHSSKIRVSFLLFAPLLYRFGECFIPNPGGCRIGARPIDRVIQGMRSLGVEINYNSKTGYYQAKLKKKVQGYYQFSKPTHTGTELMIMLSVFADQKVVLENCALEPEIDSLIEFLNQSGAKISKKGRKIEIEGVKKLTFKKPFYVIEDRNEAVTYAVLAVATGGKIVLKNIKPNIFSTFIDQLKKVGGLVTIKNKNQIIFSYEKPLYPSSIETSPHPGFMTDWQPNWAVLMTQAKGVSFIHERVFENRFSYVEELKKLGAKIEFIEPKVKDPEKFYFFNYQKGKTYFQMIKIYGKTFLHNGILNISDLRAGATLAIAALIAHGESVINNASILERGYEKFVQKIQLIGGEIKKI